MHAKPALNEPEENVETGKRPYEMEGRSEERAPLFGFEDLAGWRVHPENGAGGELIRTREQQMWGDYVGKLTYAGKSEESRIILRPPAPIPIAGEFDCISMWIYGNNWEWVPEQGNPMVHVAVLITDSAGKEEAVYLTRVRWMEWWLAHKKLPARSGSSLSGIQVWGLSNSELRSIFLDSIYVYKEDLKPLKFGPRPARNLTLLPGQDQGLNGTGPGRLPFPTREETILPTNFSAEFTTQAREVRPGEFEFTYRGSDCELTYACKPAQGGLGEITVSVNGRKACAPMHGGGIEIEGAVAAEGTLVSSSLKDGIVHAVFDLGEGAVRAEYMLRIMQKSLVIDFICRGGKATGVSLGEIGGITDPKLVVLPFLTFGGSYPKVLCFSGAEEPLFQSVWVDWYRSNGSTLWTQDWAQLDSARINGGVRYLPKTDGRLNDLYERVFLTVSPIFEETLPTIANPPTPHGDIAGERLWQESWGPGDYNKEHERSKMLRSYGIDNLTQCNHEITWRDGGESFTLRTRSAPGKGGDEALREYVAAQKSLGWLSGLYTNYTDYAPVNEYWDEDMVQRTPEGEWRAAWPRCYALKPSRAVEWDAKLAPIIQEKFGSNAAYTDVHTAVAPWAYCDFDARVPGAGTFAATFYAYGELLLHDQKVYGPAWSEGTFQWLYAGLATGNYGLAYGPVDLSKEPLNVAFDLMKIHPLECDIGMPWTGGFHKEPDWSAPEKIDRSIDHFIAATIAYGHIGWLVEESHGIERTCRSYYMLQQLQKRYALRRPARIEYADASGEFVSASKAIAAGAMRDSRLHVLYENGLHVYVNGSGSDWTVDGHVLPPWGWSARDESGEFAEFSALLDGRRVDYVRSPEYEYLDGRGSATVLHGLGARGGIAVRREKGHVEIIDIHGNSEIGFRADSPGDCTAYDAQGRRLGNVELRWAQDGMVWLVTVPDARRYVFVPGEAVRPKPGPAVKLAREVIVPGEQVEAGIEFASGQQARIRGASAGFEGSALEDVPEWAGAAASPQQPLRSSVRLALPKETAVGGFAWIRATIEDEDGGRRESWQVLRVAPAFEIELEETGERQFTARVRTNLADGARPGMRVKLKSEESAFRCETDPTDPLSFRVDPVEMLREASDTLVVQVSRGGFEAEREFAVRSEVGHPAVWRAEDQGFAWGYACRGEPEVAGAMGSGADSGAAFYSSRITSGGVTRPGIFVHPPWKDGVGYTYGISGPIEIPESECEFRTWIGIKDGGNVSDGVEFTAVAIDDRGAEHVLANEHWKERRWSEVSADLAAFGGRTIRLKLICDVGPNDDSTADWAAWGEPRVVRRSPVTRVKVGS